MKSKYWVFLLTVAMLICMGLSIWLLWPGQRAQWVEVWSDGQLVETVNLGTDRVLTVESRYGTNVISVHDGKIGVTEADCPDHYCIKRGMCDSGIPIVCLPN